MTKPTARRSDLEEQLVDSELVIYDLRTEQAHCLSEVTMRVRDLADGTRTVDEIVTAASHPEITTDAVWAALDALADADLLEERMAPPAGETRVSRRNLVRNLAAASALIAVPGVMSILTPTPAQAQSAGVGEDPAEQDSKASENSQKEEAAKSNSSEQDTKLHAEETTKEQRAKGNAEQNAKEQAQKQTQEQQAKTNEQFQKQSAEQSSKGTAEQNNKEQFQKQTVEQQSKEALGKRP